MGHSPLTSTPASTHYPPLPTPVLGWNHPTSNPPKEARGDPKEARGDPRPARPLVPFPRTERRKGTEQNKQAERAPQTQQGNMCPRQNAAPENALPSLTLNPPFQHLRARPPYPQTVQRPARKEHEDHGHHPSPPGAERHPPPRGTCGLGILYTKLTNVETHQPLTETPARRPHTAKAPPSRGKNTSERLTQRPRYKPEARVLPA